MRHCESTMDTVGRSGIGERRTTVVGVPGSAENLNAVRVSGPGLSEIRSVHTAREVRERNAGRGVEFTRYFPIADIRTADADGKLVIEGYAAVFNARSVPIWGMFVEEIRAGAFAQSIAADDVLAFWNHDSNKVLGRRSNQSLTLEEDAHGLKFRLAMPANTTHARDAYEDIRVGNVKEMSFGFEVISEQWTAKGAGALDLRELVTVKLGEISPVAFPAYKATEVEARGVWDAHSPRRHEGREGTDEHGQTRTGTDGAISNLESQSACDWELGLKKRGLELLAIE